MITAVVFTAALGLYVVLLAGRGIELVRTGETAAVLLGAGVLLLPLIGIWAAVATWRSGLRVQRLARTLAAEGGLPDVSELPRRPSGRIDRDAADGWFEQRRAEVVEDPTNWRCWYRLAYAYDIAGDRRRARETMRRALELADRS
ncbi:hypothetical protein F8178_06600 [Haloechinothrix sp. LS1_15]|nr:hypothetical protein [Haloechinothrix sp. LS1_15]